MNINDTIISLPYKTDIIAHTKSCYLFNANNYKYIGKVYYFKMYDNGTLVRDFIPVVRNLDNKPGLYDKVTDTFFTNAGTGDDFIVG